MPTWSGWEDQFLNAAGLPQNPNTRRFLSEWASHAATSCGNNPIDLSRRETGSVNCHRLTSSRTAQRYASHASAAHAFNQQLHGGAFPHLLVTLESGRPYSPPDAQGTVNDLTKWGSINFAGFYNLTLGVGTGGGGGGGIDQGTSHAHSGWNDLRHSFNHVMPGALNRSRRNTRAALRSVSRGRKVHL